MTLHCIMTVHAAAGSVYYGETFKLKLKKSLTTTYDLNPLIVIPQNINETGLVIINGKLTKPFTSDHIKIEIKFKNTQGNWETIWCKI